MLGAAAAAVQFSDARARVCMWFDINPAGIQLYEIILYLNFVLFGERELSLSRGWFMGFGVCVCVCRCRAIEE